MINIVHHYRAAISSMFRNGSALRKVPTYMIPYTETVLVSERHLTKEQRKTTRT